MNGDQAMKEIERRLNNLENAFRQHRHIGTDSRPVRFRDIDFVLYNEYTIDPSSLADGAGETQSVTFAGANLNDFVLVSASYDLQDITVTGYVQATDTVEIRIQNESGGTIDLGSGTWHVIIIKNIT
jgi:hypothetical protein